jgi:hypothetical protein
MQMMLENVDEEKHSEPGLWIINTRKEVSQNKISYRKWPWEVAIESYYMIIVLFYVFTEL